MAVLGLTTNSVDVLKRTLTHSVDLSAGAKVKMELGADELDTTVTPGKKWTVQATLYIVETDA